MRNDQAGFFFENGAQPVENLGFGLSIDAGQTIVENQHRRIHDQRARQRGALLLPAGKRHAALADQGLKTQRKNFQIAVQLGDLDGAGELLR